MKYVFSSAPFGLEAHNCGIAILKPGWSHPSRTSKRLFSFLEKGHVKSRKKTKLCMTQNMISCFQQDFAPEEGKSNRGVGLLFLDAF